MVTVVTGWSPRGYHEYGMRFLDTFHRHWPSNVGLVVYGEQPVELPRGEFRLLSSIPECAEFLSRNDNSVARGKRPAPGKVWKQTCISQGYNFRFDAWKFCRQGFIPYDAAKYLADGELLCWLDADVITFADIPEGFIEGLLPVNKDVAFLGRGLKHSEIGFQLYRMPAALKMLEYFSKYYSTGEVFSLREWHSAFVFDRARIGSGIKGHDLTPGGDGHVWFSSPLAKYTDHLKGKRKMLNRSPEAQNV